MTSVPRTFKYSRLFHCFKEDDAAVAQVFAVAEVQIGDVLERAKMLQAQIADLRVGEVQLPELVQLSYFGEIVVSDPSGGEVYFYDLSRWIFLKGAAGIPDPGGDVGLVWGG